MSVTVQNNQQLAAAADYNPFAQEAVNAGVKLGHFLSFDGNTGEFLYGPKDSRKTLPHGTQLSTRMAEYRRGWYCWKEGDVVDKVLVGIYDGLPPQDSSTLADYGPYKKYPDGSEDGWTKAGEATLIDVNAGEAYSFSFFGDTKVNSFARFCGEYGKVFKIHSGEEVVFEIGSRAFEPKGQRKGTVKYAPTFKIVGWLPADEFDALSAKAAEAQAALTDAGKEAAAAKAGADNPANYVAPPVTTVEATKPSVATVAPESARARRFANA